MGSIIHQNGPISNHSPQSQLLKPPSRFHKCPPAPADACTHTSSPSLSLIGPEDQTARCQLSTGPMKPSDSWQLSGSHTSGPSCHVLCPGSSTQKASAAQALWQLVAEPEGLPGLDTVWAQTGLSCHHWTVQSTGQAFLAHDSL